VSYKVTEAFIENSRSKHGARTVGLIIAEVAHYDGVGWIRIEPTKAKKPRIRPEDDVNNIVFRTKLSPKQVRRCIDRLQDLDELEVVRAWDGRSRYFVYRLIIEPMRLRDVDYARGGLSVLEAPFWTPEELLQPVLERRPDGHEHSPAQLAQLKLTRAQNVPSSDEPVQGSRGDIGPPDEGTSAQPPYKEPVLGPVLTREANASLVPADAGERESRKVEISLALSAELGVQLQGMTRHERGGWEKAIAELVDVGATGDEITARCAAYRARWVEMTLTPLALVRHWSSLGADVETAKPSGFDGWLEKAPLMFDRGQAHDVVDDYPKIDDAERARRHGRVDERFDEHERRAA
jgi:hypothetical protein